MNVVLERKQSHASIGDVPSCPADTRTKMDEYMNMKMDLELQDVKSIQGECDPDRVIRLLYANSFKTPHTTDGVPSGCSERGSRYLHSTEPPQRGRIWETM